MELTPEVKHDDGKWKKETDVEIMFTSVKNMLNTIRGKEQTQELPIHIIKSVDDLFTLEKKINPDADPKSLSSYTKEQQLMIKHSYNVANIVQQVINRRKHYCCIGKQLLTSVLEYNK
tara:strand:+ start:199 stop:552 length:354 start_codon:yes stop_codon:yes gene_type:complete